jgi:hypothetical protein
MAIAKDQYVIRMIPPLVVLTMTRFGTDLSWFDSLDIRQQLTYGLQAKLEVGVLVSLA